MHLYLIVRFSDYTLAPAPIKIGCGAVFAVFSVVSVKLTLLTRINSLMIIGFFTKKFTSLT